MDTTSKINEIKEFYAKHGCTLLSERFVTAKTKMDHICKCGRIITTTFSKFRKKPTCLNCQKVESLQKLKVFLEDRGMTLLSSEWVTTNSPVDFICHCGRQYVMTPEKLRMGGSCRHCQLEKIRIGVSTPYDVLKEIFEKEGCQIDDTNYRIGRKIKYTCSCGNKSSISMSNFKRGHRCYQCGVRKQAILNKQWWDKNGRKTHDEKRAHRNEYIRLKRLNDINFAISCRMRGRLNSILQKQNLCKSDTTMKLVGCSWKELKDYLEKQFTEGMSWERFGEMDVDHIIPLAAFDLSDEEERVRAFHYTNLQPMWRHEHRTKLDKLPNGKRISVLKKSQISNDDLQRMIKG